MKFNVRVRIVSPHGIAIHETQEVEADTGLAAMKAAQADPKNASRGLVSTQGADSLPAEPVVEAVVFDEPMRRKPGRPPKDLT